MDFLKKHYHNVWGLEFSCHSHLGLYVSMAETA